MACARVRVCKLLVRLRMWECRYTLITPLIGEEWGKGALIMRGWVPAAWRSDRDGRAPYEPQGLVSVLCGIDESTCLVDVM